MLNRNWTICEITCWAVSGVAGLLAFWAAMSATTFIAGLMMGVALTAFLGLALTRIFCSGSAQASGQGGSSKAAPVDTASVAAEAARTAPAAPTSGATAPEAVGAGASEDKGTAPVKPAAAEAASGPEEAAAGQILDYDKDGVLEGTNEGKRPEALNQARGGQPDNLKEIKGVGPKLEALLHSLGFYHFDQIAGWTPDEVAWVDANLEGFRGRVSRDEWVKQATILATGGETEFSKRVEDGDVY